MPGPIVIHVLRPYASEEEYLAREGTSISAKSMLLIDQPALPVETAVVFDVTLGNGQKPIRAEGKVLSYEPASAHGPGGLRVRFKRFGAATKAFIDRAVASAGSAAPAPAMSAPPALGSSPNVDSAPVQPEPAPSLLAERSADETSGVHRKAVLPVAAPANREALLERLRARRAG